MIIRGIFRSRVIAAWALLLAAVCIARAEPAPRIAADQATFEFGDRPSGEKVRHTFVIRNEGDLALVIDRVRSSCGCTAAAPSRREIPPGETAEITAEFSLAGRSGRQSSALTIESNDPANPRFPLVMRGNAVMEVTLTPRQLFMGQLASSAVVTQQVEAVLNTPVRITGVESSTEYFVPTLEVIEEGKRLVVRVVTRPPLPSGAVAGQIELLREDGKRISIPASATIVGPLTYAPQQITLRMQDGGNATRHIIVRPGQVRQFEVTGVECPDPYMRASLSNMGGNGYRVQIDHITPRAELHEQPVVIRTNLEDMPEIRIPFLVSD